MNELRWMFQKHFFYHDENSENTTQNVLRNTFFNWVCSVACVLHYVIH